MMNNEELNLLIKKNIDDYIKKYSIKHHITVEEAHTHIMVKIAEAYFRKENFHD